MNTKLTALSLAAASALAFAPKPATAGDNGAAIVGGLIGGLIIGSALSDDCDARTVVVRDDRCDDGYWKTVSVNVWVPGVWVIERSHHGRSYRRYIEGHYECRNDRVWVAYDRRGHGPRGHREIGRGPGRYDDRHDRHDRHDRRHDRWDRR